MSDPYTSLATFLEQTDRFNVPLSTAFEPYLNSIRASGDAPAGALTAVWPGIMSVLQIQTLPAETARVLVDEVIDPIIASNNLSWSEVEAVVGSEQVLLGTVRADTHDKIRQAALSLLSCFRFSGTQDDRNKFVVDSVVDLISVEKLSEGLIARVERTIRKFLKAYDQSRTFIINRLCTIRKQPVNISAIVESRIQELTLVILRDTADQGIDDISEQLILYSVQTDDMLEELVIIQFYESLLELNLPPQIFHLCKPAYKEIAVIYRSSDSVAIERSSAARALGLLALNRPGLFEELDSELKIVQGLIIRDEIDQIILTLIPGDQVARKNPEIVRSFPVSSGSLINILCNFVRYSSCRDLLQINSQKLLRLPVPELLKLCKDLASSVGGASLLISMPAIMDIILTKTGKSGYELTRLRGDIIDSLADVDREVTGLYWAGRIREAKTTGIWGRSDTNEAFADIMDTNG
ncbi:uncharacterized protein V1516DRAFT_670616 [Lipomyces oligophaga]|uniref:uncharacterized protein n=1 Tax=Lipomyces oligophaga TaxID=45792 RepID=UPI0034D00356